MSAIAIARAVTVRELDCDSLRKESDDPALSFSIIQLLFNALLNLPACRSWITT